MVTIDDLLLKSGEDATLCLAEMERQGISKIEYIGPFGGPLPMRGDVFLIPKGTRITSTHPHKNEYVTKRSYTVKIHGCYSGYTSKNRVINPMIKWIGAGGYWCHADLNVVQKLHEGSIKL